MAYPLLWDRQQDLKGWHVTEKLEGIQVDWNGKKLSRRKGFALVNLPGFINDFPKIPLEGFLISSKERLGDFTKFSSVKDTSWDGISFVVYDAPGLDYNYITRLKILEKMELPPHLQVVQPVKIESNEQLLDKLNDSKADLFAYNPKATYTPGYSGNILRIPVFFLR